MKRYCSYKDIDLVIDLLRIALKNTDGQHSGQVITPSVNRVIFQLEEYKKEDMAELIEGK